MVENKKVIRRRAWRSILLAGTSLGLAAPLTASGIATAAQSQETEVIIVTAQKREESLEDVPVSIQVLDQEFIYKEDLRELSDYVDLVPSVSIEPSTVAGAAGGLQVRGIGRLGGLSSTWALYVDGFDLTGASTNGAAARLNDPERIEILRGPQGTSFGRNVVAGAINITTQTPDPDRVFGRLALDAGSNETYGVIGSINIPLTDNSAVLLSGFYDTTEGNVRNIGPSGGTNDATNYGGRISYYTDLSDRLTVKASVAYEENQRGLRGAIPDGELFPTTEQLIDLVINNDLNPFISPDDISNNLTAFFPEQNDTVSIDADESSNSNQLISILRFDYDFGPFSLISVNGYAKSERFFLNDDDSSELPSITSEGSARNQFGSTELRLQSNGDNRLDWVAGIFGSLSRNDSQFSSASTEFLQQSTFIPAPASLFIEPADLALFPDNQLFIINAPPGTVYQSEDFTYEGRAYAIFGDVNFEVTDRLSLLAGARYNYDQFEQRINRLIDPVGLPGVDILGSEDEPGIGPAFVPFEFEVPSDKVVSDAITWRVSAVYELTDRLSPYATISTGYRPGGLQLQNTRVTRDPNTREILLDTSGFFFDPEAITNYELGLKGTALNGAVRFSAAGYFMDWEDVQVLNIDEFTGQSTTGSAGAEALGAEAEFRVKPIRYLDIIGGVAFVDTEITEFDDQGSIGQPLPDAPRWSATATVDYQRPIYNDLEAFGRATYSYVGERNDRVEPEGDPNQFVFDAYSRVDIRFGLEKPDSWRLEGYVDNATDEIYAVNVFNLAFSLNGTQFVSPPGRQFGARFIKQFN